MTYRAHFFHLLMLLLSVFTQGCLTILCSTLDFLFDRVIWLKYYRSHNLLGYSHEHLSAYWTLDCSKWCFLLAFLVFCSMERNLKVAVVEAYLYEVF